MKGEKKACVVSGKVCVVSSEVCVVCGKLFKVTEEVAVFHGLPEKDNPAEGPWVGPHWHVFLPVCPACRAKKQKSK